jgi:hypothetical protein
VIPDRAPGKIILNITLNLLMPKAYPVSLYEWGTARIASTDKEIIIGTIIKVRTVEAASRLRPVIWKNSRYSNCLSVETNNLSINGTTVIIPISPKITDGTEAKRRTTAIKNAEIFGDAYSHIAIAAPIPITEANKRADSMVISVPAINPKNPNLSIGSSSGE